MFKELMFSCELSDEDLESLHELLSILPNNHVNSNSIAFKFLISHSTGQIYFNENKISLRFMFDSEKIEKSRELSKALQLVNDLVKDSLQ